MTYEAVYRTTSNRACAERHTLDGWAPKSAHCDIKPLLLSTALILEPVNVLCADPLLSQKCIFP